MARKFAIILWFSQKYQILIKFIIRISQINLDLSISKNWTITTPLTNLTENSACCISAESSISSCVIARTKIHLFIPCNPRQLFQRFVRFISVWNSIRPLIRGRAGIKFSLEFKWFNRSSTLAHSGWGVSYEKSNLFLIC